MILIETGKFKDSGEYLTSLSKPAQKNIRFALKNNPNVAYREVKFYVWQVQAWMDLWGRQLIRGQQRPYAFGADALFGKNILCFEAFEEGTIALQFVEVEDGYMNCHPVMYEKEKYSKRYLSKFMWFHLLSWAIDNKIKIVDLGGGIDENWREMIKRRAEFPNPAYKWMYVPEEVKKNPDKQQNYKVEHYGISKRIYKIDWKPTQAF